MSLLNFVESAVPATAVASSLNVGASNETLPRLVSTDDAGNTIYYAGVLSDALAPSVYFTSTTADFTGTNVNTAQPIFNTTEDVITLPSLTSFFLEASLHIETVGTTSHTLGLLFEGTATLTSIGYRGYATNAATEVLGTVSGIESAVATITVVSAALASATHHSIWLHGIVRINAGGTFIPKYQWSAAPGTAGKTLKNSWLRLTKIGSNTVAAVGPWA